MLRLAPARGADETARRMRAYLNDPRRGGTEISDLVGRLGTLGEVGIFGGMPRDIALGGPDAFHSDVDIVVDTSAGSLAEWMRDCPAERNRFGGYKLKGRFNEYDVWALPTTWAVSSGHVRAAGLPDLVHTTFFNCDAVVYLCSSNRVHHDHRHLGWLHDGVVDINLEANPNPEGVAIRAIRFALERRCVLGAELSRYLGELARDPAFRTTAETMRALRSVCALDVREGRASAREAGHAPASHARCVTFFGRVHLSEASCLRPRYVPASAATHASKAERSDKAGVFDEGRRKI